MSHSDNIEESQSLVDTLHTSETKNLFSTSAESLDLEGVPKSSTPLPDSSNVPRNAEGTLSTTGILDANYHVVPVAMDLSDIDDVPKSSTPLPDCRNAEDTLPTSGTLDPNNEVVLAEQPDPRTEEKSFVLVLNEDNIVSQCRSSDSGTSRTATSHSIDWTYYETPPSCGILGWYLREYTYLMHDIRKKGYLLPFEFMCLAFTIGCCFMGARNWPLCPADEYIPRYVFFNGALATFSVCMEIVYTLWRFLTIFGNGKKYYCALCFGWAAVIMTLVEMVEFYTMSYSFHRVEANYCNETFYWFVHYKNIAFGVIMALIAVTYVPIHDYNPRLW